MALSDYQLEELKDRADIVQLVGERVELRKAGKDFMGLCPFHGERTPSFYVVPNKRIYHCFGCGETGDVLKFFMKLDGMGFIEAVKLVAARAGVSLEEERVDPQEVARRRHHELLAGLVERAVKFYEQRLLQDSGKAARDHLAERGVNHESMRRFRLGFAGHSMDELSKALEKAEVPTPLAVEAGLVIESRRGGRPFDRFHGRLIIPIRVPKPPHGLSVGLGGRYLPGVTPERHDRKTAKYINSPESPLYDKGRVLYGLDVARDAIRKKERAVIVEGYFDVIGVHQAGLPLAVATCGTSLTPGHLDLLMRTGAKEVVFLFDGDKAGMMAAGRAAELCAKNQVPARVATLPAGLDPDDYARKNGLAALEKLLDEARPAVEILIDRAMDEAGSNPTVEDRVRAVQSVRAIVLASPEGLSRQLYIGQIAERLKVSEGVVEAALEDRRPAPRRLDPERPHQSLGPRREPVRQRPSAPADPYDAVEPERERQPEQQQWGPRPTRAPAPAPNPNQGIESVFGRRTFAAEFGVVVALLRFPVLAPTVTQENALESFQHPVLKHLGQRAVESFAAGQAFDGPMALAEVPEMALRRELDQRLNDAEGTLDDDARHLSALLDKLRQEGRRMKARLALEKQKDLPQSDEARQAFEKQLQEQLLESRRIHSRISERSGVKPRDKPE